MLKEVGTSGQISLGKKYAGQLFDLRFHDDGRVEMQPMRLVPAAVPAPNPRIAAKATDSQQSTREWVDNHRTQIDQYNTWASAREPYSQRVRRWREQGV